MSSTTIRQYPQRFSTSRRDFTIGNSQACSYYNNDQFYYPAHRHSEHIDWIYVAEGELHQNLNGHACTQKAGDLLWIREGDWHEETGHHLRFFNFCCTSIWMESAMRAMQATDAYRALLDLKEPPRINIPENKREAMARLWQRCWEMQRGGAGTCLAFRLVSELFADYFLPLVEHTMRQHIYPDWLCEAMYYIQGHVGETISSEQLADVCEKSPEHIARVFQQHLGTTPSQYINSTRLNYAARLLSTTDRPIQDISMSVGFGSLGHFYRLFKKRFNRSPRVFRQEHFKFRTERSGPSIPEDDDEA